MNKIVNKFWGVLPFIMIVFCGILVTAIEKVTDNTFRILPRNILICLGIICFGVLLLWLNTRKKIKMSDHRIFSLILKITSDLSNNNYYPRIVMFVAKHELSDKKSIKLKGEKS